MHRLVLRCSLPRSTASSTHLIAFSTNSRRFAHALAQRTASTASRYAPNSSTAQVDTASESYYSEEELEQFYQNLLIAQPDSAPQQQPNNPLVTSPKPVLEITDSPADTTISQLTTRFATAHDLDDISLSDLRELGYTYMTQESTSKWEDILESQELAPYQSLLMQLTRIIARAEVTYSISSQATQGAGPSSGATRSPKPLHISLALVSYREWFDIIGHCVNVGDMEALRHSFTLMMRSGLRPPSTYYTSVLERLAGKSKIAEVENIIDFMKTQLIPIGEDVIQTHVKAYVQAHRLADACTVLHSYESAYETAPANSSPTSITSLPSQPTYNLVINSLVEQNTSHSRSLAWDMFAHMRYVAHPVPEPSVYGTMLNACARAPESQVERAIDLWTEMCVDNRLAPTKQAYNGLILACARASANTKDGISHAHEAFRYAREMLDAFRAGAHHLKPDAETFGALLESAKRTGDLIRARWILTELAAAYTSDPQGSADLAPDAEIMAHVFQAYAAYRPPFARNEVKAKLQTTDADASEDSLEDVAPVEPSTPVSAPADSSGRDAPQTHAEVIQEANTLFERILYDTSPATHHPAFGSSPAFANVKLTTHLFNSYLSIHYAHSNIEKARAAFEDVFYPSPELLAERAADIKPNARTYVLALQRCAMTASTITHGNQSAASADFATLLWRDWKASGIEEDRTLSARTIEKVWGAMIRILTLSGRVDEAVRLVHEFAKKYPPHSVLASQSSPATSDRRVRESVVYGVHERTHLINTKPSTPTTPLFARPLILPNVSSSVASATEDANVDTTTETDVDIVSEASSSPPPAPKAAHPRPLVQLASPSLVADPRVPPYLAFADVEILHQRLLVLQRIKDVGYLNWLTRSYAGGVRRRREGALNRLGGNLGVKREETSADREGRDRRKEQSYSSYARDEFA